MKILLTPGLKLCSSLGNEQKFALIALLILAPLAIQTLNALDVGLPPAVTFQTLSIASLVAGALSLYLLAALYVSQNQTTQLFAAAIARFAKGDLSARINMGSIDEMGRVAKSFNDMGKEIKRMIAQVSSHAEDVAEAATKLSHRASEVRTGSQQQTDSATSVAAAVEQMTTSIEHVSNHAGDTEQVSRKATQLSEEGERVVRDASDEMQRIAEVFRTSSDRVGALGSRTEEVGRIVQVIQDIAEQTNLLALNAAIEAARAGEQGRGFAVVADEVRKLAERTGKATTEISTMIETIQESTGEVVSSIDEGVTQVGKGVELTSRAGDALADINKGAKEALAMVQDIANAVKEQSSASTEISESIERITTMAQSGNENMNHMSDEAERLDNVASSLKQSISTFSGGTTREAAELVEHGAQYLAANGRQKAFASFSDPHGEFVHRDLYIFVYDMDGNVVAHGGDPKRVGKNMIDAEDADGKKFVRERINIATQHGSGWQDYLFRNPETGDVEHKTSYIRRVNDLILGCGVYK